VEIRNDEEEKIFRTLKRPFYICHGEYEFLQKELAVKIASFLLPDDEKDSGFTMIDGSESNAMAAIYAAASERSLFSSTQIIVVDNAQAIELVRNPESVGKTKVPETERYSNWSDFARLVRIAENPDSGTHIIFIFGDELKTTASKSGKSRSEKAIQRLFPTLEEKSLVIHFRRMYDEDMSDWIMKRALRTGLRLNVEQCDMLLELAGKDVRHLSNEIEKIATFARESSRVETRDLRRIVTSSEDIYVNYMIDYMLDGRGKPALVMLERSFDGGAHPVFILTVVVSRLRALWQAKYLLDKGCFPKLPNEYKFGGKKILPENIARISDADRSVLTADARTSILSRTPFGLFQILKHAARFSLEQIEESLRYAASVDRRLKGISRPKHGTDEIMIQNFIVDLAKGVTLEANPN